MMMHNRAVVECVYKNGQQLEQHARHMLNAGYVIQALNGYQPEVAIDRPSAKALFASTMYRTIVEHAEASHALSVTYRMPTAG